MLENCVQFQQAMISLHRMADKGLFREFCFFLVFFFSDPTIFLKWGIANCVEKLNRLTTTVRNQNYFNTMIWVDNAIDN